MLALPLFVKGASATPSRSFFPKRILSDQMIIVDFIARFESAIRLFRNLVT